MKQVSNSIKSFNELFKPKGHFEFLNIFNSLSEYFAHTHKTKKHETLEEHMVLVFENLERLLDDHASESVLDRLILDSIPKEIQRITFLAELVKKAFFNAILFHDFGKVNHLFQVEKMGVMSFSGKIIKHEYGSRHSIISAYLFLQKHLNYADLDLNADEETFLDTFHLGLSYSILKHHSSYFKSSADIVFNNETKCFAEYFDQFQLKWPSKEDVTEIHNVVSDVESTIEIYDRLTSNSFPLYSLIRLNFSLLTAADYLATGEYMSDLKIQDFGVLSKERKAELIENVKKTKDYNASVFKELEGFSFVNPKELSGKNLNTLRKEMAVEVLQNVRANTDKNLFYLEAPTGGGKTNLSMLATAELLKADESLNKVFYVFPFTTLITQTYTAIKEVFGLRDDEVIELHAKTGIKAKEQDDTIDGVYGSKKKQYLDHLFLHYPFCLLTHIRFFDIIKTNKKEVNYLLHRLANSVVVIDELQSYNPSHWDKLVFFIQQYAKYYNIKFIVMSATLPKIDELNLPGIEQNVFTALIPNAKAKYFRNPNFGERVSFNLDALKNLPKDPKSAYQLIADKLIEESNDYAKINGGEAKPIDSVYTIIEFIFKKSATEFYKLIKNSDHPFNEVFVLSGTILEHRRKYIINFLKNPNNRKKKVLLITTQVVEAGVDIDMDLGFKNVSLIDSDEQLAGRINRNVNKQCCKLFLFDVNKPGIIYDKDLRFQETKKFLRENPAEHLRILEEKDFGHLYGLVVRNIEAWNKTTFANGKLSQYLEDIKHLRFESVNDNFKLIDQDTLSVFVPLSIPLNQNGESVFDKTELTLLHKNGIAGTKPIDGSEVFEFYLSLLERKTGDFISNRIDMKMLSSIMSKFVFSVFASPKIKRELAEFSNAEKSEFGYVYLSDWDKCELYTLEYGLDESQFTNVENQFL